MTVPAEIEKLIKESGNSFHSKVARWLVGDGWHIRVSPYYMDQSQNKAREIDLVAEKLFEIQDFRGRRHSDLVVRLFVECEFVPGHSVFWFSDKDKRAAMKLACSLGVGFKPDNTYTQKHHYLSSPSAKVAKLFATSKASPEQDPFYKALNQVLSAQVAMRNQASSIPGRSNGSRRVLNCPVIVCSSFSGIYAADFIHDVDPVPVEDNFLLEVQYAYTDTSSNSRDDYFLIDVVEFEQLPRFSAALDRDAQAACFMLRPD